MTDNQEAFGKKSYLVWIKLFLWTRKPFSFPPVQRQPWPVRVGGASDPEASKHALSMVECQEGHSHPKRAVWLSVQSLRAMDLSRGESIAGYHMQKQT